MTEKNPADRQDAKPLDGSPQKELAPNPSAVEWGETEEKVTYDDLYWRADSDRIGAEAWCTICYNRVQEALAKGDEQAAETYRRARRGHARRAALYLRMQYHFADVAGSVICKAELGRLARLRKEQAERDALLNGEAAGCA